MNWPVIKTAIRGELVRLRQEVRDREVIPSSIEVRLPDASFSDSASALEGIAAELGEDLLAWAEESGFEWFGGVGPRLSIEITGEVDDVIVECRFEVGVALGDEVLRSFE